MHLEKGSELKSDGSTGFMIVEQIQDQIANIVKPQLGGDSYKTYVYDKPYTKSVYALGMPCSYQPLKFQKFDGKGNANQHVTHFVETCNNAIAEDHMMIK